MQQEDISLHGFKSADIARLKADLIAVYRNLDAIEAELDRGKQSTRGNSMQGKRPLRVPGRSVR
jgi:hypothetical protein